MKYPKVQEETLKNKVAYDFFAHFDCTEIIEKIDFTVKSKKAILSTYFLWAEAKADSTDIAVMLAQLILTIGKARTFDKSRRRRFSDASTEKKSLSFLITLSKKFFIKATSTGKLLHQITQPVNSKKYTKGSKISFTPIRAAKRFFSTSKKMKKN